MADPNLQHYTVLLASQLPLSITFLRELMLAVERNDLPVSQLARFQYGRVLEDLSNSEFEELIGRIAKIDITGKWVALSLIWSLGHEEVKNNWWGLVKELVLTQGLWDLELDISLEHRALTALNQIIEEATENEEIKACTNQLISYLENSNSWMRRGDAYVPLRTLIQKYFDVSWPQISGKLSEGGGNEIYSYLGASTESRPTDGIQYEYVGLLFEFGNYEKILDWCQVQPPPVLREFASRLPITNQNQPKDWHPFTLLFLERFGSDDSLLQAIDARLNTWGASGSVEGMYRLHLELFQQLIGHSVSKVQNWALKKIDQLPSMIRSEHNHAEEFYIK